MTRDEPPHPFDPAMLRTAADVDGALARLLGCDRDTATSGVLHVTAVREHAGRFETLAIDEHAPRSAADAFLLGAARARAAALLTSGQILRAEPDLRWELSPDARVNPALAAWRRELGFERPPAVGILTRGHGLDLEHPALRGGPEIVILTGADAPETLHTAAARAGIEVVVLERPGARAAVEWLARRGPVTVELGPSSSRALYEEPVLVDTLWLSCFEGALPPRASSHAWLSRAALEQALTPLATAAGFDQESSRWSFGRWARRSDNRLVSDG